MRRCSIGSAGKRRRTSRPSLDVLNLGTASGAEAGIMVSVQRNARK
jgi:hypothetical protein